MLKIRRTISYLFCLISLLASPCWAWQGKVVGVYDGDTIEVLHDGKDEKIRLYGIDAPEKTQDFGQEATQFTSDTVLRKTVEVKAMDIDRYGRTVGLVTIDGACLDEELVKAGLAWVYTKHCKESFCAQWKNLQEEAKGKKIGLWSMPAPTPPWDFRSGWSSGQTSQKDTEQGIVYLGDTSLKVFHRPECPQYNCRNCIVDFKSRAKAISAGYKPCGICNP